MKALILNSGLGHRMGVLTSEHPKCMTEISARETILSRQLKLIADAGIREVVMTTGYFDAVLVQYCNALELPLHIQFVNNPLYAETNYIYSIYCARELLRDEDILLMHGDLVFEFSVLEDLLRCPGSCMKVSSTLPLPEKDFKAVVRDGMVEKVGVEFFTDAMEAQALYKLNREDWQLWLDRIIAFCENDQRNCYAEKALTSAETEKPKKKGEKKERVYTGRTKLRFSFKEQREYDTIDDDIAALEQAIADTEKEMSANTSDYVRLQELSDKKDALSKELDEKMERWVYLNDLAERIGRGETV